MMVHVQNILLFVQMIALPAQVPLPLIVHVAHGEIMVAVKGAAPLLRRIKQEHATLQDVT